MPDCDQGSGPANPDSDSHSTYWKGLGQMNRFLSIVVSTLVITAAACVLGPASATADTDPWPMTIETGNGCLTIERGNSPTNPVRVEWQGWC